MVYLRESSHPANLSREELLGTLAGTGVPFGQCSACGEAFEHGDAATVYVTYTPSSPYGDWEVRAVFCTEEPIAEVDDVPDGTDGAGADTAATAIGMLFEPGESSEHPFAFAVASGVADLRADASMPLRLTNNYTTAERHDQFRRYVPAVDGETVAVPTRVLEAVLSGGESGRTEVEGLRRSDRQYLADLLRLTDVDLEAVGLEDEASPLRRGE